MKKFNFFAVVFIECQLFLSGCVSSSYPPSVNVNDPYESYNRQIFVFNDTLDHYFLRPIAVGYNHLLPRFIRRGVNNIYGNISDINTSLNRLLQGKLKAALCNINRVLINSTLGLGGFFDLANRWGIKKDHSDFGITLAHWGSRNRPFLTLPFLGSATLNELVAIPIDVTTSQAWIWIPKNALRYSLTGGYYVQNRAALTGNDDLLKDAFDPYIFMRNAYLQRRQYLLNYDPYSTIK